MKPVLLVLVLVLLLGCRPELGDRDSLITHEQILAVRGDPPEAKPGTPVTYTLFVASPAGVVAEPHASFAYCASPRLLTDNGVASEACAKGTALRPIGAVPSDACGVFGPDVTSADLRPHDPDVTGGFYQPVRVALGDTGAVTIGLERVACKLANANADVVSDFAKRYASNANPTLLPIAVPESIAPGATITLHAAWNEPERYVVYDLQSHTLVDRRESMRVSWFATAGTFASDRTGREENDPATFTDNEWTAPNAAQTTHLFVVLRDARGGVAFASYELVTR